MSKKVLMIIAPDQYRDEELTTPRKILQNEGWQVDTVSTQAGIAKGMLGATEEITKTVTDVSSEDYDAVVVVGGGGSPQYLWENSTIHSIVADLNNAQKTVAAICLSGAVLAKANILSSKKATVWNDETAIEALKASGAEYTGEPVTIDGNIITANGPDAAQPFGEAIVASVKALVTV